MYHFFQNILKNAEERNIARTLPYTVPGTYRTTHLSSIIVPRTFVRREMKLLSRARHFSYRL